MEPAGGSEAGAAGVPAAGEGAAAPPTTLAGAGVVKGAGLVQGRSCKGCLFYSSVLRSKGRGPVCVGITRSIPQVPDRLVGEIELGAIQEGRHLSNFKYACAGYSIYLDDKDNPPGKGEKRAQLPICVGVELLADRAPTKQAPAQAPAHLRKEGCNEVLELQCLCLKPTSRPHQKLELGTKLNEEIKKETSQL
uniref:Uncharacterized protein n=1 Tax=Avena sativa TaxID=4498 RepID=A0ACD6ACM8_AVESA